MSPLCSVLSKHLKVQPKTIQQTTWNNTENKGTIHGSKSCQ